MSPCDVPVMYLLGDIVEMSWDYSGAWREALGLY